MAQNSYPGLKTSAVSLGTEHCCLSQVKSSQPRLVKITCFSIETVISSNLPFQISVKLVNLDPALGVARGCIDLCGN